MHFPTKLVRETYKITYVGTFSCYWQHTYNILHNKDKWLIILRNPIKNMRSSHNDVKSFMKQHFYWKWQNLFFKINFLTLTLTLIFLQSCQILDELKWFIVFIKNTIISSEYVVANSSDSYTNSVTTNLR